MQAMGDTLCLLSSRFCCFKLRRHGYQEVGLRSSGEKRSHLDGSLEVSIQARENCKRRNQHPNSQYISGVMLFTAVFLALISSASIPVLYASFTVETCPLREFHRVFIQITAWYMLLISIQ
ncbi:hypothetical protein B0H14DRAFT_1217086 [Mycena olivaceomarginata]|nr:hypothetical protein B0H14DRAFT_1217086 [Mycena olivaceomarginata]